MALINALEVLMQCFRNTQTETEVCVPILAPLTYFPLFNSIWLQYLPNGTLRNVCSASGTFQKLHISDEYIYTHSGRIRHLSLFILYSGTLPLRPSLKQTMVWKEGCPWSKVHLYGNVWRGSFRRKPERVWKQGWFLIRVVFLMVVWSFFRVPLY